MIGTGFCLRAKTVNRIIHAAEGVRFAYRHPPARAV
jgi:hypothetical protein